MKRRLSKKTKTKKTKTRKTSRKTRAKKTRASKTKFNFSKLLILTGILLLLFSVLRLSCLMLWPKIRDCKLSRSLAEIQPTTVQPNFFPPSKIIINKIKLDLAIERGGIENDEWVLFNDKASFLSTSGLPGEGYNTIIYAHNKYKLFANLKKLAIGDKIEIIDAKDNSFIYKVNSINRVESDLVRAIKSDLVDTLTLFTCDGSLDQYRLVVQAKLQKNEN